MIWRDKLTVPVQFPLEGLDLSAKHLAGADLPPGSAVYDCISVVNHFGSMMFGHYTAFSNHAVAREANGAAAGPGKWYNFDDGSVSPTRPSDVVSPAAYILVYKRRKTAATAAATSSVAADRDSAAPAAAGDGSAAIASGSTASTA